MDAAAFRSSVRAGERPPVAIWRARGGIRRGNWRGVAAGSYEEDRVGTVVCITGSPRGILTGPAPRFSAAGARKSWRVVEPAAARSCTKLFSFRRQRRSLVQLMSPDISFFFSPFCWYQLLAALWRGHVEQVPAGGGFAQATGCALFVDRSYFGSPPSPPASVRASATSFSVELSFDQWWAWLPAGLAPVPPGGGLMVPPAGSF